MLFEVGKTYRRHQIHSVLGGELQTFLPQYRGRIVCGCFKLTSDPRAPHEVLVEDAPKVKQKAEILCEQGGAIPVFIKRQKGRWEYKGLFRVKKHSADPEEIKCKQQESGREYIASVLYLEQASEIDSFELQGKEHGSSITHSSDSYHMDRYLSFISN